MRATFAALVTLVVVAFASSAVAANFEFHGDFNNRFLLYTNQARFFTADRADQVVLADEDIEESYASIKYRLWTEASTNDGKVKGIYAIELGAVRFGRQGSGKSQGGAFSGDGVNIETRWAYTDLV